MKRIVCILLFAVSLSLLSVAQDPKPAPKPEKPLVVEPVKPKVVSKSGPILNRLSFLQAKRLGFHSAGIRAAVEKLQVDEVIVPGETGSTEAAVAVFDHIRAEREAIEIPDVLRDLLIAFIEAMLKSLFDFWPI